MNNDLLKKVQKEYEDWINGCRSSLIDIKRCYPTAIIASQIFDHSESDLIRAFGYSTLWLFGIDRWFDERVYTENEILKKVEHVLGNMQTDDPEEYDLTVCLKDIKEKCLSENALLVDYSFTMLKDTLYQGMLYEHKMRFRKLIPKNLDEYILHGRESIGVKFVNSVVLNSIFRSPFDIDHTFIDKVQNLSAEIIRLMNDYVTLPKEIEEGNKNYLTLFSNSKKSYAEIISDKQEELIQLDCPIDDSHKRFYTYVLSLVKVTLKFYSHSDFYDEHKDLTKKLNEDKYKH